MFGGLAVIGILCGAAGLIKSSASSTSFKMTVDDHYKRDHINYERQFELKKMAQSAKREDRIKFDQIFGRPLRSNSADHHDLDRAIYYIACKEGWTYCHPEDRYYSEKVKGDLWAKRRYWYENIYPDQKKWMEWYLKYSEGHPYTFYTGVFPEDYDTEEEYHDALRRRFYYLDDEIQARKEEREAKERLEAGIKINEVAVELVEELSEVTDYNEYVNILWSHFKKNAQTRSQCAASVYAWILLRYKTVKERAALIRALEAKLKSEKMNTLKRVYAKSVDERWTMFSQYNSFNEDESCAIGIDCMELAWKYNTDGEKETLEFIRDKLYKIVGESTTKMIMEKKFMWHKRAMIYSPIFVYKIFD